MSHKSIGISQHLSLLHLVHRIGDGLSIATAMGLAIAVGPAPASDPYFLIGAMAIILFYLLAEATGLYRSWRGAGAEHELFCVLVTWVTTLLVMLTVGFATKYTAEFSRLSVVIWILATPITMGLFRIAVRIVLRILRSRGFNSRGCAVVGVNELSIQLARNILNSPELGLKLHGFFDDRPKDRTPALPTDLGERLGNMDELVAQSRDGSIETIYITFPMRAEERIRNILERLSDTTASVYLVPDFFVFELLHSRWTSISGLPAVSVFENPLVGVDGLLKRMMDILLGGLALIVVGLPMLVIAAAVKFSSPGPVFFRQRRYGLDGREINVWKFRTMRVCEDGEKVVQATKGDPRVTRLGAFLRKTSLDELPQLFNVIEGTMSLVGPRPHANAHNELYRKSISGYMLRHKVRPGITGLAQVNGWRGETDTLEKMEGRIQCDHRYIREWSLWMDIRILFKTIFVVFSRKNAY